jgi:hypothetical protein
MSVRRVSRGLGGFIAGACLVIIAFVASAGGAPRELPGTSADFDLLSNTRGRAWGPCALGDECLGVDIVTCGMGPIPCQAPVLNKQGQR